MFSTLLKTNFNFSTEFNLSSSNAFDLDQCKNLSFGKQLISSENRCEQNFAAVCSKILYTYSLVSTIHYLRIRLLVRAPSLQISFRELMEFIETGFIPLSLLTVVTEIITMESSQWLRENIVREKGNSRKAWTGTLAAVIQLK